MGVEMLRTNEETWVLLYKINKQIIDDKEIMQVVLRGQLYLENEVNNLINLSFIEPKFLNLHRKFFPEKLDLLVAVGALKIVDIIPYKKFNDLRRNYAHNLDYEVDKKTVVDIVNSFSSLQRTAYDLISDGGYKSLKDLDTLSLLKIIIYHLCLLLALQYSPGGDKKPGDPLGIEEIESYASLIKSDINHL
jgi:hypothetical protein